MNDINYTENDLSKVEISVTFELTNTRHRMSNSITVRDKGRDFIILVKEVNVNNSDGEDLESTPTTNTPSNPELSDDEESDKTDSEYTLIRRMIIETFLLMVKKI